MANHELSHLDRQSVQKYLYPPVTEAVIEIKVDGGLSMDGIEKISKKLQKNYPHKVLLNDFETSITFGQKSGASVAVNSNAKGVQLASDDQVDIIIISKNSLAVSRLAPYLGWDDLYSKFILAWKSWKKVANTKPVVRLGVRFINRIDIPLNVDNKIELHDYLTFYPNVPNLSPEPMIGYLIQVTQPAIEGSKWSANITSTTLQSPLVNNLSLLLDVDVFRSEDLPLKDEELWTMIAEVRTFKNAIFNKCLTSKAQELFS